MAQLKNLLFKKSYAAFPLENQDKRDQAGTYQVSFREFQQLQTKIRALFCFIVLFFIIIVVIIFVVFPHRFSQTT
jgi:t-SNARE complex subunit (syntaxin)